MKRNVTVLASVVCTAVFSLPSFAQERQPVSIRFAAEIAGRGFSCSERYGGIGITGSTVSVADFRLYVSEVALLRADGSAVFVDLAQDGLWQHQNVALLDFESGSGACANGTAATNDVVRGTVPRGDYVGLAFNVGVPFALNHADPTLAPSPLNLTAMFWNWQGGYKFVRIDLSTAVLPLQPQPAGAAHGAPSGWSLHLGSTVCAAPSRTAPASSCAFPNRMTIRMPRFDPSTNVVVIDPAPVLAGANVDTNAPETSPGCMSFPNDPDCLTVMARLGLPYGNVPAAAQEFIRMR